MSSSVTNEKGQAPVSRRSASDFRFKTSLNRPLSEMSLLRRSLAMAESSMISYLLPEECNKAAGKLGFVGGKYFRAGRAQAYWLWSKFDSIVVFRGTEPNEWNDIQADANTITTLAETVGRVHRDFKTETDELWPLIEKELENNTRPLYFTGHSLGGAMATICTSRCLLSYIHSEPAELHTFGSPRVGCRRYINHAPIRHFRWVNYNDIVTRIPPPWLGYRHGGREIYLNDLGQIREITGWKKVADRLKGFFGGLRRFRIDQLSDHSTLDYVDHIFEAVRLEEAGHFSGLDPLPPNGNGN